MQGLKPVRMIVFEKRFKERLRITLAGKQVQYSPP